MTMFWTFALAVDGSASDGSSCCGCTVTVCGWLSPNASAFRPGSARLDCTTTSNDPVPPGWAVVSTEFGLTDSEPTVVWNGTLNLSPLKSTPCCTTAFRPCPAGPATTSSGPPVAVLNAQVPLPRYAFWLPPTVSIELKATGPKMFGSGNGTSAGPNNSVSRSVTVGSSHVVSERINVPFGTGLAML